MPRAVKVKVPRASPKSGKQPPNPPLPHPCLVDGCPWSYARPFDLRRHNLTHMSPEERAEHMHRCPYSGCTFSALQASNLRTHLRTHTGEKPESCPNCDYTTGDPASLTTHRKTVHGYQPGPKSRTHASGPLTGDNAYPSWQVSSSSPESSSSAGSSSPASVYSDLSGRSWGASSTYSPSAFDLRPVASSSSGYPSPGYVSRPNTNNYAYPGPSTASWSANGDVIFDTATGMPLASFPHGSACTLPAGVGCTPRPGTTGLYPAENLVMLVDAEMYALRAEADGLATTPESFNASAAQTTGHWPLPTYAAWGAEAAAPPGPRRSVAPSVTEEDVQRGRQRVFATEWTGVPTP
ncbi:hypothetical protein B0H12DRAFT_1328689 [Mycena haematopus]|nr:hypothetical protein B0H12DRAFT_1328689 [Mycena haematopus]